MKNLLLIATSNPGKQREFKALLTDLPIQLVFPKDLGIDLEVEENGSSYLENALLKAKKYFKVSGIPTIADDSGLEVEVLNGEPGINSHRYTGSTLASDAERRKFLLNKVSFYAQPWKAAFQCALVVIDRQGFAHNFHGSCQGELTQVEKGLGGFGYDPIFYISALKATMAELDESLKNKVSHRANAVIQAYPHLKHLIDQGLMKTNFSISDHQ